MDVKAETDAEGESVVSRSRMLHPVQPKSAVHHLQQLKARLLLCIVLNKRVNGEHHPTGCLDSISINITANNIEQWKKSGMWQRHHR